MLINKQRGALGGPGARSIGALISVLMLSGSMIGIAHATGDAGQGEVVPSTSPVSQQDLVDEEVEDAVGLGEPDEELTDAPIDQETPSAGDGANEEIDSEDSDSGDSTSDDGLEGQIGFDTESEGDHLFKTFSDDGVEGDEIVPFNVGGPETGVGSPYLYWTVKDGEDPVGGASFTLEGPRSSSSNWGRSYTVQDCVASAPAQCTGLDKDPDPGEFQVVRTTPRPNINNNRWRITPKDAPESLSFTSRATREMPSNISQAYDFGEFQTLSNTPSCAAGYIYSITSGGQLKQIDPDGTVTDIGSPAGVSNMNGLGIGQGGDNIFAYQRTSSTSGGTTTYGIIVYKFNQTTGEWARAGNGAPGSTGTNRDQISTPGSIPVGGAVCSCTGTFFMGGFNTAGTEFHLYMYDPSSSTIVSKGKVTTSGSLGTNYSHNGDLVFDSVGNLYIVRSTATGASGTSSTLAIFSVPANDLATANSNTTLTGNKLDDVSITMGAANGVAFDSAGRAYLQAAPSANSGSISSFRLPLFDDRDNLITNSADLSGTTDLASCSAPPSIQLRKEIVGERFAATDQFKLAWHEGTTELVSVTTDGPASGPQTKVAGPILTQRGAELTFSEIFTRTSNYATTYECIATDTTPLATDPNPITIAKGTGTSHIITVPTEGPASTKGQIICTFSNSPLKGSVTWNKNDGKDGLLPGSEWTITGPGFPTGGQLVEDCTAGAGNETQCTGLDKDPIQGQFKLEPLAYGDYTLVETKAPEGYVKDPTPRPFTIDKDNESVTISVEDTKNLPQPKITLLKETCGVPAEDPDEELDCDPDADPGDPTGWVSASGWNLKATGSGASNAAADVTRGWVTTGEDGSAGTWTLDMQDATNPASVTIQEQSKTPPWRLQEIVCKAEGEETRTFDNDGTNPGINADSSVSLDGIEPGSEWECTFRNRLVRKPPPGNVSWEKVGEDGGRLEGSEWKIEGPYKDGVTPDTWNIKDCVADTQAECFPTDFEPSEEKPFPDSVDVDPSIGGFRVYGFLCGTYELTETKAPLGYKKLTEPIEFQINGQCNSSGQIDPDTKLDPIVNELASPKLPLTGGLSAFSYFVIGGGLLGVAALGGFAFSNRRNRLA